MERLSIVGEDGGITSFGVFLAVWLLLGWIGAVRRVVHRWEVRDLYRYDGRETDWRAVLRQVGINVLIILTGALGFLRWVFWLSKSQREDLEELQLDGTATGAASR